MRPFRRRSQTIFFLVMFLIAFLALQLGADGADAVVPPKSTDRMFDGITAAGISAVMLGAVQLLGKWNERKYGKEEMARKDAMLADRDAVIARDKAEVDKKDARIDELERKLVEYLDYRGRNKAEINETLKGDAPPQDSSP